MIAHTGMRHTVQEWDIFQQISNWARLGNYSVMGYVHTYSVILNCYGLLYILKQYYHNWVILHCTSSFSSLSLLPPPRRVPRYGEVYVGMALATREQWLSSGESGLQGNGWSTSINKLQWQSVMRLPQSKVYQLVYVGLLFAYIALFEPLDVCFKVCLRPHSVLCIAFMCQSCGSHIFCGSSLI